MSLRDFGDEKGWHFVIDHFMFNLFLISINEINFILFMSFFYLINNWDGNIQLLCFLMAHYKIAT